MDSTHKVPQRQEVQAHQQGSLDSLIQEEIISKAIAELQSSINQDIHL